MDIPSPQTFQFEILDGQARPGHGLVATYIPGGAGQYPVVLAACDPRHDPGQPIENYVPAIVAHLRAAIGDPDYLRWAILDAWGRFYEVIVSPSPSPHQPPLLSIQRFPSGLGTDAFFKDIGAAGEAAIEVLSLLVEGPSDSAETPSQREFIEAVEAHGNLPSPGAIFQKVEAATERGDARAVAGAIQPDPVISATLINFANAARFASAQKTASVPESVQRLGLSFVRRTVFVAEMLARYQKGACPDFQYKTYWINAIATGAAMRGLLEKYQIPARMADDAFTTGLLSGIGWLAVAETFPALMSRFLQQTRDTDPLNANPIARARAAQEIFPTPIRRISEVFLARYAFPEIVQTTVAGTTRERAWLDCLSQAARVGQSLAPFDCHPFPSTLPIPDTCREEWDHWRGLVGA